MSLLSGLDDRTSAFVLVSLLSEKKEAPFLLSFLPNDLQKKCTPVFDQLLLKNEDELNQWIVNELKRLAGPSQKSPLADLHPDFLIPHLKQESPRMIAAILRHLPSESVRLILESLTPDSLNQLPSLTDTFSIHPDLLEVIRQTFELKLTKENPTCPSINLEEWKLLEGLAWIHLKQVLVYLGVREMAMAFKTLPQKMMDVFMARLSHKDSVTLQNQITALEEGIEMSRLKKAQFHILALELNTKDAAILFLETGISIFVKSLPRSWQPSMKLIYQKMPRAMADLMQHYLEKSGEQLTENNRQLYFKEVLSCIHREKVYGQDSKKSSL